MKYIVETPENKKAIPYFWQKDSEHDTVESAQARATELTGFADPYTEPGVGLYKGYFGNPAKEVDGWDARIVVEN